MSDLRPSVDGAHSDALPDVWTAAMNAIGYVRVSTDEQALGADAQRAALDAWCAANGATLVACYADHVSGATPPDDRPGFMAALAALYEHGAQALLITRRDRMARDPMVAGMIDALVGRAGARVVSCAGEGTDVDPNDPTGFLARGIADLFAAYERMLIRARTRAALAVKMARGETAGRPPYGFRSVPYADGRVSRKGQAVTRLEPHPAEQEAIRTILQLHGDGTSLRDIARSLTAAGVAPRGARWHHTTVERIIQRQKRKAVAPPEVR